MSLNSRIDWSKIDFSRPAKQIAEDLGCSLPTVYAARQKYLNKPNPLKDQKSLLEFSDQTMFTSVQDDDHTKTSSDEKSDIPSENDDIKTSRQYNGMANHSLR